MTEAEKKAIYDKEYSRWLEYHKTYFSRYESHLRIPLKERREILEHFKCIFDIMKKCGVCRFEGEKPMSNVTDFLLKIKTKGDPNSLGDILISNHESCWTDVIFEQTAEEIEAAARGNAQLEVDLAEYREKKALEEAEEKRKEEEWLAAQKAQQDKNKKEQEEWLAAQKQKEDTIKEWFEGLEAELELMRTSAHTWFAEENLTKEEVKAIGAYVNTLFSFTDAQNEGLTGIGLYAQNSNRADAHAEMLDVFKLLHDPYAEYATKSYDFADDYDYRTQKYHHRDFEKVVDMIGYALAEARKATAKEK